MHSFSKFGRVFVLLVLAGTAVFAVTPNVPKNVPRNSAPADDYVPDVTDRVARLSFLIGEASVRRSSGSDWERAVANLPIVAGDEIATGRDARVEIQFDTRTYLRIAEESAVQFTTLSDGGIAVSVRSGSVVARTFEFDKARAFFEIDAPKTTVAIQKSGIYRVDAGQPGGDIIRVVVTSGGEARLYSDDSGLTLRDGRSAALTLDGNNAGEWQTSGADAFRDGLDAWNAERDAAVAKRLDNAYYDKYYDRDMYGAEDLSDSGEWIYTRDYGYVWRPFSSAVARYADWSPYRYGAWRWVAPYGWTWVGDEPWGWATYHYGRWVWDNGYWVWSPYGYYRYRRSWWQPALVQVTVVNNTVCWYPLPYNRHNSDFNASHGGTRGNNHNGAQQPSPNPTPTGLPSPNPNANADRRRRTQLPSVERLPPGSVVSVPMSEFGRGRTFRRPPIEVATEVISRTPDIIERMPVLPTYKELGGRVSKEIIAETPPIIAADRGSRIGAGERRADAPLDNELRNKRIYGDRTPLPNGETGDPAGTVVTEPRRGGRVGAVQRPPLSQRKDEPPPVRETPPYVPPREKRDYDRVPTRETPPIVPPPAEAPTKRETPRYDPPPRQETPRYDPAPRSEPAPQKEQPQKSDPPPKIDRPVDRKGKDGR